MFVVVHMSAVPEHLRGYLGRFLQEAGPQLFVGVASRRVVDRLWEKLEEFSSEGAVTLIHSSNNETGFEVRSNMAGVVVRDFDGIQLPIRNHSRTQQL